MTALATTPKQMAPLLAPRVMKMTMMNVQLMTAATTRQLRRKVIAPATITKPIAPMLAPRVLNMTMLEVKLMTTAQHGNSVG